MPGALSSASGAGNCPNECGTFSKAPPVVVPRGAGQRALVPKMADHTLWDSYPVIFLLDKLRPLTARWLRTKKIIALAEDARVVKGKGRDQAKDALANIKSWLKGKATVECANKRVHERALIEYRLHRIMPVHALRISGVQVQQIVVSQAISESDYVP